MKSPALPPLELSVTDADIKAVISAENPYKHPKYLERDYLLGSMSPDLKQAHTDFVQKAHVFYAAQSAHREALNIMPQLRVCGMKIQRWQREDAKAKEDQTKAAMDKAKAEADKAFAFFKECATTEYPDLAGKEMIVRDERIGWNDFPKWNVLSLTISACRQ